MSRFKLRNLGSFAIVALLLLALAAPTALAFNNQPNGWGDLRWGSSPDPLIKSNAELRKRYNAKDIQKALKEADVTLNGSTQFLNRSMGITWVFSDKGLQAVSLRWEDTSPEAFNAWQTVLDELQQLWGPADSTGKDGELIWMGDITRAEARKRRVASGSGIEIRLTALKFGAESPQAATDISGRESDDPKRTRKSQNGATNTTDSFIDDDSVFK